MVSTDDGRANPLAVCAGILVADLFVPLLPRVPAAGEIFVTEDFLMQPGGCAANVATCLAKLGVRCEVVGRVGNDSFGDFIDQNLRSKSVGTRGITSSSASSTSKTVILPVVGEDHRYIHTIGANADFAAQDIERALVSSATVFYLGGLGVLPALKPLQLVELFRFARSNGSSVVLDVVVPGEAEPGAWAWMMDVLQYVDVFMPNEQEAFALTGEREPRRQAQQFLAAGCGTAIITRGAQGAFLMTAGEIVEMPAFQVAAIDASGAGDAFAAGFIVGLMEGWSMHESLRFASAVGASACTQLGCTPGVFGRAEADAYVHAHPLPVRKSGQPLNSTPGI
jgi:sugar/nucleoside kinase (ribokinase family)